MKGAVHLQTIATWFPDEVVPIGTLPETSDLTAEHRQLVTKLGIEGVRDADELDEVDLAQRAADRALAGSGTEPAELDGLVLVQGRAPEFLMSSEVTRLQQRLGADRAMALGVGDLGCVSSSAALTVGAGLLLAHPQWRTVLVAMGVRAPTWRRYRHPMTVLGDGALAAVLTRDGPARFRMLDHVLQSNGRYADLFRIRYRDTPAQDWIEECADPNLYSFQLAMESRARIPAVVESVLERSGTAPGDLRGRVMQNLSTGAFTFWEGVLEAPFLPVCARNLKRYGHVGPVDVLLNLDSAYAELAPGDRVLALNSSPVAAWSATVFERLADDGEGT